VKEKDRSMVCPFLLSIVPDFIFLPIASVTIGIDKTESAANAALSSSLFYYPPGADHLSET
jgi:hypothetical protein